MTNRGQLKEGLGVSDTRPASTGIDNGLRRAGLAAFVALFVLTDVFYLFPSLDLGVARLFASDGRFPVASIGLFIELRKLGMLLFRLLLIAAFAGLLFPLVAGGRRLAVGPRWSLFFLASSGIGAGLIVNLLLKDHWGRARPVMVTEFGGAADYTRVWEFSHACSRNCSFVSGEASTAMLLTALVLLAPPAWRRATAGITIALALVFSVNRLAFGGHFLSDVTLSWCITLIVMALCQEVVCRLDEDRLCAGLGRAGASLRRRFGGR
jgi:membrane-associated phospholipid phosphatase